MGDKQRSEIKKPVKNTLLSGASHGFPFENFQGSSLLIPVSQDSPSVLNDSSVDVNKLGTQDLIRPESVTQDLIQPESITQLTHEVGMTSLKDKPNEESKNQYQASSQGYTGIFSSFFGGGGQNKQELNLGEDQQKNSNQPPLSSVSSTPRSSSPFVTVPNIQSFSPALQVPTASSENCQNTVLLNTTGFSKSFDYPFSHPQSDPGPNGRKSVEAVAVSSNYPQDPPPSQNVEFAKTFSSLGETNQSAQAETQNFSTEGNKPSSDLRFGNQSTMSNYGFESFYISPSQNFTTDADMSQTLLKAQSAIDLPVSSKTEPTSESAVPFFNSPQPPQFYQVRSGSVDSFKSFQSPPLSVTSPLPTGPPLSLGGPPMSSGASRNYRRGQHKRLAYAPVPGLTSDTAISSAYLQPCENLPSQSISALVSTPTSLRQPLSTSLSQPTLNLSTDSNLSDSSVYVPTVSALNLFPSVDSQSSTNNVHQQNSGSTVCHGSLSTTCSFPIPSNLEVSSNSTFSVPPSFNSNINQTSSFPLASTSEMEPSFNADAVSVSSTRTFSKEPSVISSESNAPERPPSPSVIPPSLNNLANLGQSGIIYRPAYHHWFFKVDAKDAKEIWHPFSMTDSLALEQAFNSVSLTPDTVVPTDGGRYDVNVTNRIRTSVYWEEEPKAVRRCSWFYRSSNDIRFRPYDENTAYNLEEEYKKAVITNTWNKKVDLPTGEYVIMYGPSSMGLFQHAPQTPEGWEAETDYTMETKKRAKIVKRGVLDDFEIDDGESPNVDHLVFVVHGIGSFCDFKFRNVVKAVESFRSKSLQLIKSHFRTHVDQGTVNRVEVLPVSWHKHLHGENTGVDRKLKTITLNSIPRLRHFTNDTLLDILFYTSPVYCQNIIQQVGREMNVLFEKFKSRNPSFKGGVSLVGHSLGSLILFDMLCHQKPISPRMGHIDEVSKANIVEKEMTTVISTNQKKQNLSRNVSYVMGTAGTGQPFIEYPQLTFHPVAFFAMGSPIGMFVTVRGIDSLGLDFCMPTCSRFFNIFHPFDPVAYRMEALINPELAEKRPVLIPHHKGRKRMHLELRETMARVGADLKQRLVDSVRSTWNTVYHLTTFGRADDGLEQEVDKVIENQLERQQSETVEQCINECDETEFNPGRLNLGRRIDYVLQEAPLESFNEYVSALTSHVIYWDSEDTILLILKEIYGTMGLTPDNQITGMVGMQEDIATPSSSNMPSTSTIYDPPPAYGFK